MILSNFHWNCNCNLLTAVQLAAGGRPKDAQCIGTIYLTNSLGDHQTGNYCPIRTETGLLPCRTQPKLQPWPRSLASTGYLRGRIYNGLTKSNRCRLKKSPDSGIFVGLMEYWHYPCFRANDSNICKNLDQPRNRKSFVHNFHYVIAY